MLQTSNADARMLVGAIPKCLLRHRLLWMWMLALPFVCGFGPPRLVDDSYAPNYRLSTVQLKQWAETQALNEISAHAALVYDLDSDRLLFAHNATKSLPPASLTKLMTALLVLESGDLKAPVTIFDVDLVGDSTMGLQAGEVLSVEQLLYGLLINSGNDAAVALARHEAGSVEAFVDRMNQRARELNLDATNFLNPHGLDAEGHRSSAHDLLQIIRKVWEYPIFREIVGIHDTTIAGHFLLNTNELLGVESAVNGVKTGTTDEAGECLITGVVSQGHQRFVIVLGSTDRYADTRRLMALADTYFPWQSPNPWQMSLLNRKVQGENIQYFRAYNELAPVLLDPFNQNSLIGERNIYSTTAESGAAGEIVWKLAGKEVSVQPLYDYLK